MFEKEASCVAKNVKTFGVPAVNLATEIPAPVPPPKKYMQCREFAEFVGTIVLNGLGLAKLTLRELVEPALKLKLLHESVTIFPTLMAEKFMGWLAAPYVDTCVRPTS